MLKTNLATRPFYNERAVHTWLFVGAILVVAATAFNISRVLRYSRSDTRLVTQASRDEARAADLRRQASRLRATVDPRQIEFKATEARLANELIDRRTFSWTELFNRFETTLPDDIRIAAVRPHLDRNHNILLTISVVARSVDDVNQFIENLEKTGAFAMLRSQEDHVNDEGQLESQLETRYVPSNARAAGAAEVPGAAPAPASGAGAPGAGPAPAVGAVEQP
jgi:Tfp pilus assembly protein PilN